MLPRDVRFLASRGDISSARSVLVLQTGATDLLARAIDLVRATVPSASVTVLLQRNMPAALPRRTEVEYLDNTGSKRRLVELLRARRFDAAFVLYVDQPGFWKLKLLPFAIGVPNVLAINEHMGWFPVALREPGPLIRHLYWRTGSARGGKSGSALRLARNAARAAAQPAVFAWLAAYEKLVSLRADTSWKREHDPR